MHKPMSVFVTRMIPEIGIKLMEEQGISVVQWPEKRDLTQEELIDHCLNYDALLSVGSNKINSVFLNACSHLKVIALHSVGYDNVDVAAAMKLKIPIGNTPDVLTAATADTAFLLMLAVSRKAFYLHKKIIRGEWQFSEPMADLGIELEGKTLGIVGLGKIGFEMAKKCGRMYNMKVIYFNRRRNENAEKELNATWVPFDELLSASDVISVHCALTPETKGMFNKQVFDKMKRASIFINTARGAIHNENDLFDALQKGNIWGAGLDVTSPEPMEADNPLLRMANVAVLPHIGSATFETRNAMTRLAALNIIAGLKGEQLPYEVRID
jgi:lactate dehydrogenase-like 2-hydroxyacid dehydrogenase